MGHRGALLRDGKDKLPPGPLSVTGPGRGQRVFEDTIGAASSCCRLGLFVLWLLPRF